MDWIRENKSLAVILGIIIAATLALGYLLFDSWTRYAESKESFLALGNEVAGMKGATLAPTAENVQKKRQLVEDFAANVNKLGTTLLILQPRIEPIKNIEFQSKLKTKVADVRTAATSARMTLPADFAFGFEEYTSNLPSDAASPELSAYLDAVDALVKLFMNSGVEGLETLERSKLPVEDGSGRSVTAQLQPGSNILEKRKITAVLTLDQAALQLVVSRMANPSEMPHFTSLRLLRIENQRQEGPLRDAGSVASAASPGIPPAPAVEPAPGAPGAKSSAASDEIVPPPPAPRDAVPIIGEEKLKAYLEIDLVKFLDGARGVAAQAAPAPRR